MRQHKPTRQKRPKEAPDEMPDECAAHRRLMAGMTTHMLLQFPALIVAGGLLAAGLSSKGRQRLDACNAHGMAGLVFAALVLALAMVPRLLDLVLVDARIEVLKLAGLLL